MPRALRILAEYMGPLYRLQRHNIQDTIVFTGSARMRSEEAAKAALAEGERTGQGIEAAQTALRLSIYYEAARELARRLTTWSKKLDREERRFSRLYRGRSRHHGGGQSRRFRGEGAQCRADHLDTRRQPLC
jgi:hypothetical protein